MEKVFKSKLFKGIGDFFFILANVPFAIVFLIKMCLCSKTGKKEELNIRNCFIIYKNNDGILQLERIKKEQFESFDTNHPQIAENVVYKTFDINDSRLKEFSEIIWCRFYSFREKKFIGLKVPFTPEDISRMFLEAMMKLDELKSRPSYNNFSVEGENLFVTEF